MKLFQDKNKKTQPRLSLNTTSTNSLDDTDSNNRVQSAPDSMIGGKNYENATTIHREYDDNGDQENHDHNTNSLCNNRTSSKDIDSDDDQNLVISSTKDSINDEPLSSIAGDNQNGQDEKLLMDSKVDTDTEDHHNQLLTCPVAKVATDNEDELITHDTKSPTFLERHPKLKKYVLPTLATLGVFSLGAAASYYFFESTNDNSVCLEQEQKCQRDSDSLKAEHARNLETNTKMFDAFSWNNNDKLQNCDKHLEEASNRESRLQEGRSQCEAAITGISANLDSCEQSKTALDDRIKKADMEAKTSLDKLTSEHENTLREKLNKISELEDQANRWSNERQSLESQLDEAKHQCKSDTNIITIVSGNGFAEQPMSSFWTIKGWFTQAISTALSIGIGAVGVLNWKMKSRKLDEDRIIFDAKRTKNTENGLMHFQLHNSFIITGILCYDEI